MSKAILIAIITLFFFGAYKIGSNIHQPVAPPSIKLPLGEQNRSEQITIDSRAEVFIEKSGITINTIPKHAWCSEAFAGFEKTFTLHCTWVEAGAAIPYRVATVPVAVPPHPDVSGWNFDRTTLSAVPVTHGWWAANLPYLVGAALLTLIGLILCVFLVPERRAVYEGTADSGH